MVATTIAFPSLLTPSHLALALMASVHKLHTLAFSPARLDRGAAHSS
jgi:hypothetical protein